MGLSIWNFLVILFLYIFGGYVGGLESFTYYGDYQTMKTDDESTKDCSYDTIADIKEMKKDVTVAKQCESYWGQEMRKRLFTYVFCTFVFSQVFNYFNCRKIGQRELNVFERIFSKINVYFWASVAFVAGFQFI